MIAASVLTLARSPLLHDDGSGPPDEAGAGGDYRGAAGAERARLGA
jgi:hypothetical protein